MTEIRELVSELLAEVRSDGEVIAGPTEIDKRAASALTSLSIQVEALKAEVTKFQAIAEDKLADTRLLGAGPRGDGFGFDLMGGPIPYIAEYLFQFIGARDEDGPSNYAEIEVNHNTFGAMTLSLQRHSGKTPHQLRQAAEARVAVLEDVVRDLMKPIEWESQRHTLPDAIARARQALGEP